MDKKPVPSKSEINQEKVSSEGEFGQIEDSLRRLEFIRPVYMNFEDGYEDLWSGMIEDALP
jgi:hypothetical protein